ncbi:CoA-binding protein [Lewinella sp. W8]|uniref:CoA-binding protein n=1 Tax=Lewinella sp. W8 TaxID=2528208 RepID=UPI001068BE7F|nr:CoA-binding protein [Lewinella sp. W8]MTB53860.1 CoA-binding protein [Lewinella sp. W8]
MSTLILGATPNPNRYAYLAAQRLTQHGHKIVPVGIKHGEVFGVPIQQGRPQVKNVDTVVLYVGPKHQPAYYDYLLELKPRRIIFNPGTENPELMRLARTHDIEPILGCTLVMLASGTY